MTWRALVSNEWPTHGAYRHPPRPDDYPDLGRSPVILGVHDGHTASACILRNGRIAAAVEEERLTRTKNDSGFPARAIQECLRIAGVTPDAVDFVAWGTELMSMGAGTREERKQAYLGRGPWVGRVRGTIADLVQKAGGTGALAAVRAQLHRKRRAERQEQIAELGLAAEKVRFVEHHQCHAATAYFGKGDLERDILVLTNDGAGDGLCATVSVGSGGRLYRLSEVDQENSFGELYGMVTFVLGMMPLEHEFKVMGMAPYAGGPRTEAMRDVFWDLFEDDPGNPLGWRRKSSAGGLMDYEYVRGLLELHRFDNICGGLQLFTEEILERWARRAIENTGIQSIAGAGGVFMNVKANKALMELPEVADFFVFPSCADETIAIGAAYQVAADYHVAQGEPVRIEPIRDLYLGAEYPEAELASAIEQFDFASNVDVRRCDEIETEIAKLLADDQVVARFAGREEFGARALGNRSILASARSQETVRIINEMIKKRDFWMPFAMSVLPERFDDYLQNPKGVEAPYMVLTFDCQPDRLDEIRGAIHPYDRTSRPQAVVEAWNPSYYRVLKSYESLTGIGAVLNTSFNLHGYPLVSHPSDALAVFDESGLLNLALGPFLLRKSK